jgi:hypothetical protein
MDTSERDLARPGYPAGHGGGDSAGAAAGHGGGLIVGIDIGQATTQAALFAGAGAGLHLLGVARVATPADPTAPLAPAVVAALRQLEARTGCSLLDAAGRPLVADPTSPKAEPPSSAGDPASPAGEPGARSRPTGAHAWFLTADSYGPVRVAVAGVIDDISGQSALKAALSAGACVSDVLAINDGRGDHQRARDLRQDPVDMILLAGGVDEGLYSGGSGRQVVNVAATIAMAGPRARHNPEAAPPVVFAGSAEARQDVAAKLAKACRVVFADNVRPDLALENLAGARQAMLELFHAEIMSGCARWERVEAFCGPGRAIPTGIAHLTAAEVIAAAWRSNLLVADIGESAVNLVSVINRELNRTVSDEVGLNFDCPVPLPELAQSAAVWLPAQTPPDEVANVLGQSRLRPAALAQTWQELMIQQAAARERLRAGLASHQSVAALVKGIHRQRYIDEILGAYMSVGGQTIVDLRRIPLILATGRLVARATTPGQALGMILDGIGPQGTTQVLYDPTDVMPHLGAMAAANGELAAHMLADGWFERLAVVVAPVPPERGGPLFRRQGQRLAAVRVQREDGTTLRETVEFGAVKRIPLEPGEVARITVHPERQYDAGAGFGATARLEGGGKLGIILDGRGRPIALPQNPARRWERVSQWLRTIEAYPEAALAAGAGAGEAN